MSDNNELNNIDEEKSVDEAVAEKDAEAVSDSQDTEQTDTQDESLEKELEELRDVFQQELDKATAEAQTISDEPEQEDTKDGEENENLCLCCGEKERMDGSDYCEDCYEAMRHYPFKWAYFLVAALAVFVAVLAVGKIGDINQGWVYDYEGNILAQAGWYDDALEKYQMSQSYLYRSKVEPKMVYLHSLEASFESGGFQVINAYPTSVATIFEEWELRLPHMKTLKQYYMRSQEIYATIQEVNETIYEKYAEYPTDKLPYDDIIKEIDSLNNRVLHIGMDENGNEIADQQTEDEQGTMTSSNAVYFKRTTKYDKATIQYLKYYFADTCQRSHEEKIAFLEDVRANAPEMIWLYSGELGVEYAESGNREKALEMAQMILEHSETNVISYYINALVAKSIDNDYDKAIDYCNQGNNYSENYEFYRQMALNYILKGDYAKAQENAQTAYDNNSDMVTVNTLAFCALANGDTDKFAEMEEIYNSYNAQAESTEYSVSFPKSVLTLKAGKMTAEQILAQGGYDVND